MAGKSNKARARKLALNNTNTSEPPVSSDAPLKEEINNSSESSKAEANGNPLVSETNITNPEVTEPENANAENQGKQGEHTFSVYSFIYVIDIFQHFLEILKLYSQYYSKVTLGSSFGLLLES